jgi:hypothetical protein
MPSDFLADDTNWASAPTSISYSPLAGDQTGQNFKAFALGDVSGNWGVLKLAKIEGAASIDVLSRVTEKKNNVSYDIYLDQESSILSGGFKIAVDNSRYRVIAVRAGEIVAGCQFVSNVSNNMAAFAFANAYPIQGDGVVATIDLEVVKDEIPGVSPLQFNDVTLNEGTISIQINGQPFGKETSLPSRYALNQNYPNPFNPVTSIAFDLPEYSKVTITVFDLLGKEVARLVDGPMNAGSHSIQFNGARMASGVYFYQIKTQHFTSVKKMILLK